MRGIAAISMIESIVPAAGPIAGTALLSQTDWRGLFWILAALTALVLPFVIRSTPKEPPGFDRKVDARYRLLFANRRYRRLALSHALAVGAVLMFVASAPQLMENALRLPPSAFASLQVFGVAAFAAAASQSARISRRFGAPRVVQFGAFVQVACCALLLTASMLGHDSFIAVVVFWCAFCGALAIRGPSGFSEALSLPSSQLGRASALLVLGILLSGAIGTQAVAPFLEGPSTTPLAAATLAFSLASFVLVARFPRGVAEAARVDASSDVV